MKTTIIAILVTAAITSVCWHVATGMGRGIEKMWLMSAVKAPGRMALDQIAADMDRSDIVAAKSKMAALRKEWSRFESEDGFSGQAIGNIMVEFSQMALASGTNGTPNQSPVDTARKFAARERKR